MSHSPTPIRNEWTWYSAIAGLTECRSIEQNVEEWLADKPLSPIKIQGLSIDDIYEIWNQENFVDAVIALNKLRKDKNEGQIFLDSRGMYCDDTAITS